MIWYYMILAAGVLLFLFLLPKASHYKVAKGRYHWIVWYYAFFSVAECIAVCDTLEEAEEKIKEHCARRLEKRIETLYDDKGNRIDS